MYMILFVSQQNGYIKLFQMDSSWKPYKQSMKISLQKSHHLLPLQIGASAVGVDLGLSVHQEEDLQQNYEIKDEGYRQKMQMLNGKQKYLYPVLHHAKTSTTPIYHFLTGGAGVGKTGVGFLVLGRDVDSYIRKSSTIVMAKTCNIILTHWTE